MLVPPLILQPLVENAVRHGIATLLDGGAVRIEATRVGRRAIIVVTNPRDEDVRAARHRVRPGHRAAPAAAATFGDRAALSVEAGRRSYRVVGHPADRGATHEMTEARLRVVIVDDEEPARLALRHALVADRRTSRSSPNARTASRR